MIPFLGLYPAPTPLFRNTHEKIQHFLGDILYKILFGMCFMNIWGSRSKRRRIQCPGKAKVYGIQKLWHTLAYKWAECTERMLLHGYGFTFHAGWKFNPKTPCRHVVYTWAPKAVIWDFEPFGTHTPDQSQRDGAKRGSATMGHSLELS